MRPEYLEMEGFTAFRNPVEVDFSDLDLFVLVGPTGSGKSSIIDAITFALYGSIPRLRKGRVEPVISLGAQRARIRFQFSVNGVTYSATRVVQRTKTGATTNEARLEGGPEVVVGASELTEAVERLLGLTYEHFTKSVVLPQGKFASFLLDGSSDRQALLRELLDLGRYSQVRDLAVQRAQASEVRAESLQDTLKQLSEVTPEALGELEKTLATLNDAIEWSAGERTRLAEARAQRAATARKREEADKLVRSLRLIELPDGLAAIDERLSAATTERTAAAAQLEDAAASLEQAQASTAELGDPAEVARLLGLVEQAEKLSGRLAAGEQKISDLEAALALALGEEEKLGLEASHAETRLERLRTEHAAHALRISARAGEPCPVCRRTLDAEQLVADDEDETSLSEAVDAAKAIAEAVASARNSRVSLATQLDEFRSQLGRLTAERTEIIDRTERKSRSELEDHQRRLKTASDRLLAAGEAAAQARKRVAAADERIASITETTDEFWTLLDRHRMAVTSLEPPDIRRRDLGGEWSAFLEWCDRRLLEVEAESKRLAETEGRQQEGITAITDAIAGRIAAAGVATPPGSDPHEQALMMRAQLGERLERMRRDLDRKVKSAAALEGFEHDALIAKSLATHLKVNGFERWLIEEVVHDLVVHANERLEQLSSGAYALAVEKSDFVIIDRLNADERRAPETLSGGETFVVSLALALSLADQMASISMSGTARLESVFLDEGFGTLDSETLDTVAAVIHELGSDGRTVGLITHVSELAHQIPVRFEVSKRSGSATVERVEA